MWGGGVLGGATEALAATRCRTQHDTRHLVLMNTPSCHCAPRIPESPSLCLLIHYLLCSPNKVGLVRDTLRGEASAEDLNGGAVSGNKSACIEG